MARKLFGTDGVRGVAGEFLTAELALALARAATLQTGAERPAGPDRPRHARVGRDAAGGASRPASALPVATRCWAACCRRPPRRCCSARYGLDLAVVLSASHNPYQDNGIKFFGGDGFKLSDEAELEIERRLRGQRRVAAGDARSGVSATCEARARTTCGSCTAASPSSTCGGWTCCSTAPTAPPTMSRRRSSGGWGRR